MLGFSFFKKPEGTETKWQLYTHGGESQGAMLKAVRQATQSIDLEQYIFENDTLGTAFFNAFLEARKKGVRVRLLCDQVGSFYFFSSEWPWKLRDAGVEILFFNIISPWRVANFTSWYFRDHRKLLVVDEKVAFIGGIGIADYMEKWRDTNLRIEGGIVETMTQNFNEMWQKSKRRTFFGFKKKQHFTKKFNLLTNAPHYRARTIYHALIDTIRNAEHSIFLTTPYFTPDGRFFRSLRLAARRGVRVTLLIPEHSDVRWFHIAAQSYFGRALKSGIRIFTYQNSILHAKTAIIDDTWATVGSFNLDNLSFLWNYEANIESTDKKFIETLKSHFTEDIQNSKEVTYSMWQKRPIFDRILGYISLPIHRFL